jgi:hypothetical protein
MGGWLPRSLYIYVYTKQGGGKEARCVEKSLLGRFPCEWYAALRSMSARCGSSAIPG